MLIRRRNRVTIFAFHTCYFICLGAGKLVIYFLCQLQCLLLGYYLLLMCRLSASLLCSISLLISRSLSVTLLHFAHKDPQQHTYSHIYPHHSALSHTVLSSAPRHIQPLHVDWCPNRSQLSVVHLAPPIFLDATA